MYGLKAVPFRNLSIPPHSQARKVFVVCPRPRNYLRWIVIPVEMRSRFWSLPARLGRRVYP